MKLKFDSILGYQLDAMVEALTKTSKKIINALDHYHAMTIAELAKTFGLSTRSIEP